MVSSAKMVCMVLEKWKKDSEFHFEQKSLRYLQDVV